MVPTLGLSDQVTAVFDVPATVAVNCCVLPAFKVTVAGATEIIAAAAKLIAALADLVISAILVAVI
jgi:hypothetical protein